MSRYRQSPQLVALTDSAEKVLDGVAGMNELKDSLRELENVIFQLDMAFKEESRYQEPSDFFQQESRKIKAGLSNAKQSVKTIKTAMKTESTEVLEKSVNEAIDAFESLFESFQRLQDHARNQRIYSESPFMNEVMRVADCVRRGTLPSKALRDRIKFFMNAQVQLKDHFENFVPSIHERSVFEKNRKDILKNIDDTIYYLKKALQYLENSDMKRVDSALTDAGKAVQYLVDTEKQFQQAVSVGKTKTCFKCGAENQFQARYCCKCNFRFPDFQIQESSTLDVRLEEEGITETNRIATENLAKLSRAVEKAKTGSISGEDFQKTVRWFSNLISRGQQEYSRVKTPETDDDESMSAFREVQDTMREGLSAMEKGVSDLMQYTRTKELYLLDQGMETILQAGEKLYQVKTVSDNIRQ